MKKLTSILTAVAMSVGMMSTGAIPGYAAPLVPLSVEAPSNIQLVDEGNRVLRRFYRGDRGGWRGNRGWRGENNWRADRGWRGNRGYYRGDGYRYNGYRGYRYYRPGYRRYNDAWFPLAAFAGGLIIGNAISNSQPVYRGASSHTSWCYNRYRSYRAYDNTYQPYGGPRRQCYSPYR